MKFSEQKSQHKLAFFFCVRTSKLQCLCNEFLGMHQPPTLQHYFKKLC